MPTDLRGPVRQLTEPLASHGEGPLWDPRHNRILWLDMLVGDVLSTEPSTGESQRRRGPESVAALLRCYGTKYVLAGRSGLWAGDLDTWSKIADLPLAAGERANDGGCSIDGRLFVGCMYENEASPSSVFSYDGSTVRPALRGPRVSNGMIFTDRGVWFIDSPTHRIERFTLTDAGDLVPQGVVVPTPGPGVPDGACADRAGGIWVAMYGGSAVLRLAEDGSVSTVVEVPVPRPTSCAFGGQRNSTLFITTSAHGGMRETHPESGALFCVDTNHVGAPIRAFRPIAAERS